MSQQEAALARLGSGLRLLSLSGVLACMEQETLAAAQGLRMPKQCGLVMSQAADPGGMCQGRLFLHPALNPCLCPVAV